LIYHSRKILAESELSSVLNGVLRLGADIILNQLEQIREIDRRELKRRYCQCKSHSSGSGHHLQCVALRWADEDRVEHKSYFVHDFVDDAKLARNEDQLRAEELRL
jgi:hypothetical protein